MWPLGVNHVPIISFPLSFTLNAIHLIELFAFSFRTSCSIFPLPLWFGIFIVILSEPSIIALLI